MRPTPGSNARQRGFTLIELMVVVVVIGILAGIGIPNFLSLRQRSARSSCVSNQRNLVHGATLYASEYGVMDAVINVSALQAGGFANTTISECPTSKIRDFDDYTITLVGGRVTNIRCDNETTAHEWSALD